MVRGGVATRIFAIKQRQRFSTTAADPKRVAVLERWNGFQPQRRQDISQRQVRELSGSMRPSFDHCPTMSWAWINRSDRVRAGSPLGACRQSYRGNADRFDLRTPADAALVSLGDLGQRLFFAARVGMPNDQRWRKKPKGNACIRPPPLFHTGKPVAIPFVIATLKQMTVFRAIPPDERRCLAAATCAQSIEPTALCPRSGRAASLRGRDVHDIDAAPRQLVPSALCKCRSSRAHASVTS